MSRFAYDKDERVKAQKVIEESIKIINGLKGIDDQDAKKFLTDEAFLAMKKDPIRKLGPTTETTYPWNILDYMFYIPLEKQDC